MESAISQNIKRLRKESGRTQLEVSISAGVTPSHLGKIERGEVTNLRLTTLSNIAKALGVTSEELMAHLDGITHD